MTLKLSEPGDSGFLFLTKQSLFCMWTADGQEQRKNGLKKMLIEVSTGTNVVIDEHRPLHGLTDLCDPRVTVFFRGCVDFVHLGLV